MLSSLGWSKPFSIPKTAEMQLNFGFGTVPTRWPLEDARTSDNDSPRRAGPSIEELGELSNDQRDKRETARLREKKNRRPVKRHRRSAFRCSR